MPNQGENNGFPKPPLSWEKPSQEQIDSVKDTQQILETESPDASATFQHSVKTDPDKAAAYYRATVGQVNAEETAPDDLAEIAEEAGFVNGSTATSIEGAGEADIAAAEAILKMRSGETGTVPVDQKFFNQFSMDRPVAIRNLSELVGEYMWRYELWEKEKNLQTKTNETKYEENLDRIMFLETMFSVLREQKSVRESTPYQKYFEYMRERPFPRF